ncbi:MAG: hypothetical protein U0234_02400 [Sandaracinus sp.]
MIDPTQLFWPDWFAWAVAPVLFFEAARSARIQIRTGRRSPRAAYGVSALEGAAVFVILCTRTPLAFFVMLVVHQGLQAYRESGFWRRGLVAKGSLLAAAGLLAYEQRAGTFEALGQPGAVDAGMRAIVLALLVVGCVLSLLPVRVQDEAKGAQVVPVSLIAFARMAVPLATQEPRATLVVPMIAGAVSLVSALWLLTAGMRANHFERASLVSELLVCERGVLFSFVWLGLAAGDEQAGVGAVLEWWAGALALVALESALRVKVLPKPMAFFALAMAIGLPGTVGFVAEDLLAHGLLELRPLLAAGFVAVGAINAAALFLAIVNVIAEGGYDPRPAPPLTLEMVLPAMLSLLVGLVPRPFVTGASFAHEAMGGVLEPGVAAHHGVSTESYDIPPP